MFTGDFSVADLSLYQFPYLCLVTILSQRSTNNFLDHRWTPNDLQKHLTDYQRKHDALELNFECYVCTCNICILYF